LLTDRPAQTVNPRVATHSASFVLIRQMIRQIPPVRRVLDERDAVVAHRDALLRDCSALVAHRDALLRDRSALIIHLVRASEPGAYFNVVLNGASVWLPGDTLRTMAHCVHIRPEDGAVILLVETAHLMWMMERLRAGGTFLDVGAATGATTLPVAKRFGASVSIVAFEPSQRARRLLTETLIRNRLEAEVKATAVSDRVGDAEFCELPFDDTGNVPWQPEGSSLFTPDVAASAEGAYAVPVTTLDAEASTTDFTEPVVVKIDVEGFEVHVLRGAARFLAKHRPHLSIDIHHAPFGDGDTTEAACRELLQRQGYHFETMGHVLLCSPSPAPATVASLNGEGSP
jgi:FkbM family methyltransferase